MPEADWLGAFFMFEGLFFVIIKLMNNKVRKKAAENFLEAAGYIRSYGWQVKGMGEYGQPRCSMGALNSVWPKENTEGLAKTMYQALYKELNGLSLTEFNYKYKKGEKVSSLFEQTARSLRQS